MNHSSFVVFAVASFFMPGAAFWPYAAGTVLLLAGLAMLLRNELAQAQGMDKAVIFGPLFLALAMAVFSTDHFIATNIVVAMVPKWIPFHLFWAYFVGVALMAAAVSMTFKRHAVLAASLLGVMIFSFVLFIHIPNLARFPGNRLLLAVLLRDVSFSAGAFACAISEAAPSQSNGRRMATTIVRLAISIPTVFFGVEHFLHPELVPVVPLDLVMPSWIHGQLAISYVTGVLLIILGLCMVVNWKARLAATWLGVVVFVIVLLVYLPIVISNPSDIGNGLNYFVDTLAFSGTALLLAGALPKDAIATLPQAVVAEEQRVTSS